MRPELVKQAVGERRRVVCSHGLGGAPQHAADLRAGAGLASELGAGLEVWTGSKCKTLQNTWMLQAYGGEGKHKRTRYISTVDESLEAQH